MSNRKKPVSEKPYEPSDSTVRPASDSTIRPASGAVAAETIASGPDEIQKSESYGTVGRIVPTTGSYPFVPKPIPVDGLAPHVRAVAEMGFGDVNPFD